MRHVGNAWGNRKIEELKLLAQGHGCSSMVEHLPNMCEGLGSISSTMHKKKIIITKKEGKRNSYK
jgi:hypothetical protein